MPPVLLLDRDGVLNDDRPDYVKSLSELVMLPVGPALARLTTLGWKLLVITNQGCIGKGLATRTTVDAVNAAITADLAAHGARLDGFYICPHRGDEGCTCRKPKPGLILQAQREHGFDLASTWFVGDADRDVAAAQAAGCKPALVRTGKGTHSAALLPQIPSFADLTAFVDALVGRNGS